MQARKQRRRERSREARLWIILSLSNKHTTLYRKLTNLDNTYTKSENVNTNENGCQYLKQTNLARDKTRLLCLHETRDSSKRGMGKCYMAHVNIYVCVFQIHIYTHIQIQKYKYRKYKYYIYRFT